MARLFELLIITIVGFGLASLLMNGVKSWKASREKERMEKENRRVIAISKAMAALKSKSRFDLEAILYTNSKELPTELQQRIRDQLIDVALEEESESAKKVLRG